MGIALRITGRVAVRQHPLTGIETSETPCVVNGEEMLMIRRGVRKVLPTLGVLLYVTLSVLFGGLWYAALSVGMTLLQR
jgi:hypothetical protein